jgi:outer membrane protein
MNRISRILGGAALALSVASPLAAQRVVNLTLESAVEMAMDDSYQVRRVRLDILRTRKELEAERAGLKSNVSLNFNLPQFEQISEQRWNSTLGRNEIVGSNSRRWQMEFSIEQPLILMGYPTNGYLSLNNRVYRYTQIRNENHDLTYYNRYFVRYRQPLFQPNALKNSLERAELALQNSELSFQGDAISIIQSITREYNQLFQAAFDIQIAEQMVGNLRQALAAAEVRAAADPGRAIEVSQVQVALSNAESEVQEARSDFRIRSSAIKPSLGLQPSDSISINVGELVLTPVPVDISTAIELGITLRPQLRQLEIQRRQNEISLSTVKGRDSFRLNVELTYGREMQDPSFDGLMSDPKNSYTLGVSGTLPIWDWGARRARIEAQEITLMRTDLSIEETREQIEIDIRNTVENLVEYQRRAESMERNLVLARQVSTSSLDQYVSGAITVLDLLQSYEREDDTARNFLTAYMGYRNALLSLQRMTYYDFETRMPVLERYGVQAAS